MKKAFKPILVGDRYATNEGGYIEVVEIYGSLSILVQHDDSHRAEATVTSQLIRDGQIKNPYYPSARGIGYIGQGRFQSREGGQCTLPYSRWYHMLTRCYSSESLAKHPAYTGCTVHKDWHNFQVFAEWFVLQHYEEGWHLDKDILVEGNKEYSESTCVFVPQELNKLLNPQKSVRGAFPQGVTYNSGGYQARLRVDGKHQSLGTYPTPEKASKVYNAAKEANVRRMAARFKDRIDPRTFAALEAYTVQP